MQLARCSPAALAVDCDACLREAQPATSMCSRDHRLCFLCALQTFTAALAEASTDASGAVACPMCRGEGVVAWSPHTAAVAQSADSARAEPDPLAGWIIPSCVQRLEAWSAVASVVERQFAPGAPPIAPVTAAQLRRYALKVAERGLAHRAWLQRIAASAGSDADEPTVDASSRTGSFSPSPALVAGWLAPPPRPSGSHTFTVWERCGHIERLVTCPSAACGAAFAVRSDSASGTGIAASSDGALGIASSSVVGGSASASAGASAGEIPAAATARTAFCSVCPHCSTPVCADCGQNWSASVTLLQPPALGAGSETRGGGGLLQTLLSLAGAGGGAGAAAETVTVCHAGLACSAYAQLVDRIRAAGGRQLSPAEKDAVRALANTQALRLSSGDGAPGSAAAAASRQAEEAAFAQQVLHMARAGIKYCPRCGCPGEIESLTSRFGF